jgi:tripartite-type tricarboxylate transporter receptor subunit TctC
VTAIELPEVKTRLEQIGLEPTSSTPAGLKDFLADEVKRLRTTADQTKMLETAK